MKTCERGFLDQQRVARLATADAYGAPHLVPVCFALDGESIYITIDQKPKSGDPHRLKRLVNIAQNPAVALTVDHYEEDWSRLAWVMVRGRAEVLAPNSGPDRDPDPDPDPNPDSDSDRTGEHARAQATLRNRYPQYRRMQLEDLPVIAIRIERVTSWGHRGT